MVPVANVLAHRTWVVGLDRALAELAIRGSDDAGPEADGLGRIGRLMNVDTEDQPLRRDVKQAEPSEKDPDELGVGVHEFHRRSGPPRLVLGPLRPVGDHTGHEQLALAQVDDLSTSRRPDLRPATCGGDPIGLGPGRGRRRAATGQRLLLLRRERNVAQPEGERALRRSQHGPDVTVRPALAAHGRRLLPQAVLGVRPSGPGRRRHVAEPGRERPAAAAETERVGDLGARQARLS